MQGFLDLSLERRREICREGEARTRLPAQSLEKDFWVCWTLREMFSLPEWGSRFTFKGGTSLSKAWHLIQRFSEDIDVVIDRDSLGFGGDASPEAMTSRKKRGHAIDALKAECQRQIRESLRPDLLARITAVIGAGDWLESDPADPDGQTVLFRYPSAFEGGGYVPSAVKIEMGARSDVDPSDAPEVQPYLAETFPDVIGPSRFSVRTLAARRTFWEKAMLLHEETYRPPEKRRGPLLSRHYYDLWCLIQRGVGAEAVADADLFNRVAVHREVFFRYTWLDYGTLRRGTLRIVPLETQRSSWARDYGLMRDTMFFGEGPDFDEVLRVVGEFERTFNGSLSDY